LEVGASLKARGDIGGARIVAIELAKGQFEEKQKFLFAGHLSTNYQRYREKKRSKQKRMQKK